MTTQVRQQSLISEFFTGIGRQGHDEAANSAVSARTSYDHLAFCDQRGGRGGGSLPQIGELFLEKLGKVTQPVTRCGNVEVDEIPFCAPGPRLR